MAAVDPVLDRIAGESEAQQLEARDHAMLLANECPDSLMVDCAAYRP